MGMTTCRTRDFHSKRLTNVFVVFVDTPSRVYMFIFSGFSFVLSKRSHTFPAGYQFCIKRGHSSVATWLSSDCWVQSLPFKLNPKHRSATWILTLKVTPLERQAFLVDSSSRTSNKTRKCFLFR